MFYSLSLIPAFAAVVLGQGAPVAETTTLAAPALSNCGGCFIIANVAQVIFADFTTTQTATAVASQGVGRNGSVVSTTFIQPLPAFSFDTGGLLSGAPVTGAYVPLTGTILTLGGATLTSPTAYNLIQGYTEYQVTQVGGTCQTQQLAPVILANPSSYAFEQNAGASAIFQAEQSFVDSIPKLTCAVSGAVVSTTIPVPAEVTTVTSSTTSIFRPTPQAASQTGSSAAASSTSSDSGINLSLNPSASGSGSAAATTGSTNATSSLSFPTISQGAASGFRVHATTATISTSLLIGLLALPGLGAWFL